MGGGGVLDNGVTDGRGGPLPLTQWLREGRQRNTLRPHDAAMWQRRMLA
jgi:hypothetical protein